jgi:cytochrome c oxidase subunit II
VGTTVIVTALLCVAIWRPRPAGPGHERRGEDRTAIRWILGGTALSTVFLLAAAIWTFTTTQGVSDTSVPPGLIVDVTAYQWWWEIHYNATESSKAFTTANDLVIPAGVPVQVNLRSGDVIHSFWVPRLAGKTDTIPGLTNVARIEADAPGIFRGQCTEFCGLLHAKMAFNVIALKQTDFEAWWNDQLQPPAVKANDAGQQVFIQKCGACHAVRGLTAGGILGPDLSHFATRHSIGAGALENTDENLGYWIDHSQTVKPGSKMPALDLSDNDRAAVATFLEGLK